MNCLVISGYAVLGGDRAMFIAQELKKMEPQLARSGEETLLDRLPQSG